MKVFNSTLLALGFALAAGGASAQLKLPPGKASTTPAAGKPAAAASAAAEPSPEAKEMMAAATLAASGWLSLLDRRDWGRAWETSAAMFRSTVPLASWMEGIPKARDVGDFVSREPSEAVYRKTLEGRPNGDYVTIIYGSNFSKKPELAEIVTTVREADGKWRVTGYQTR